MVFEKKLVSGRLIQRYKRFLADVCLDDGNTVTAHCTNSGSMKSCLEPGARVFLSTNDDPKRKTKFTWEMIEINGGWVGINTSVPNALVWKWLHTNRIAGLSNYTSIRREVSFAKSRFDFYVEKPAERCIIEVKNVTLKEGNVALFPDAVTLRGQKHLRDLRELIALGYRGVMLYVIQRMDVQCFAPAVRIDPVYTKEMKEAMIAGVEVIPVQVKVSPEKIKYHRILPLEEFV